MKTMGVFLEANGRCTYTVITGAKFENASPPFDGKVSRPGDE